MCKVRGIYYLHELCNTQLCQGRENKCFQQNMIWHLGKAKRGEIFPQCEWERSVLFIPFHSVNGREACCLSLSTVWMGEKRLVYPSPQCEWERSVLFIPLHSVNGREACCLSLVYQAQTLSWGKGKEKRRQLGLRGCQFEPLTLRLGLWAQLGRLYLRCYRNGKLSLSQDSSNLCAPEGNWECSHFPMMTEHIWRSQQPGSSSQLTSLLRPDD